MARPKGDADQKMISAGIEIALAKGCAALRIRDIAKRAKVNLGMFPYHFQDRQSFIRIILEKIYGEFFEEITRVANIPNDPLGQLRCTLLFLGTFLGKNQVLALSLFKEVFQDNQDVLKYSNSKARPPHIQLVRELLARCQEEKLIKPVPLAHSLPLLMGAIIQPLIADSIATKLGKKIDWLDKNGAMSTEDIEARVDIVLRGMGANI